MSQTRLERQGSPRGWKRALFRAPIWLYRMRLGFLLGKRFLLLEHIGRKSGEVRRTVLEVVVNDPQAVYVAAAWGVKSQWLANLKKTPDARYFLGSRVYDTTSRMVDTENAQLVMARYASDHPKALDKLASFMLDKKPDTPAEQAAEVARTIPLVRLPKGSGL